jgi:hypothetical protein
MRKRLETVYSKITNKLINSEIEEHLGVIDERFYAQVREGNHLYEVRFQMYSKCNEQFVETKPSDLDKVRREILKVDESVGQANDRISELLSLNPNAYRFKEAASICKFALGLPQQRHLYSILEYSLESAPKNITEIGDFIGKRGQWDWAGVPSNIVDRRYDPKVTEDLLSSWKALGDTLERLPKEASLKKEFMDASETYAEYPKLYFEYWLGTVPESVIRSKIEKDSEQFKSLIVRNVFDELIGVLSGLLEKTVMPLRPYAPDDEERIKQLDANLDKVRDRSKYDKFYRECREVLNNWRELDDDVLDSRAALLKIKPADYLEDYAPFTYRSSAEFVDFYWTELSLSLLTRLSDMVQDQGEEAFDILRTRFGTKFPLEQDSETNLTQKELIEAWLCLNKVRLQEVFAQGTIGAGAETGAEKIDEQLKRLQQVLPPEPYKEWFEGIEQVFQCLPEAEDPYYCKIILLGQNEQRKLVEQDEKLLLDYLTEFRFVQGDDKSERFNTRSRENLSLGMFKYPNSSLQIEFYQYPSDTEMHTSAEYPQPWAPLRMLHQCYDKRKKGYIKLDVKSEKDLGGVLFLQLEFYKDVEGKYPIDFPSLDKWPSLKSQR